VSCALIHDLPDAVDPLLGVIDGLTPKGIEGEDDIAWPKNLLRQFGYKL
jgi:adenosine/AMP kinase